MEKPYEVVETLFYLARKEAVLAKKFNLPHTLWKPQYLTCGTSRILLGYEYGLREFQVEAGNVKWKETPKSGAKDKVHLPMVSSGCGSAAGGEGEVTVVGSGGE